MIHGSHIIFFNWPGKNINQRRFVATRFKHFFLLLKNISSLRGFTESKNFVSLSLDSAQSKNSKSWEIIKTTTFSPSSPLPTTPTSPPPRLLPPRFSTLALTPTPPPPPATNLTPPLPPSTTATSESTT